MKVSMKITDDEFRAMYPNMPKPEDAPDFPSGLRLRLDRVVLRKLMMSEDPEVGQELEGEFSVKVVAVRNEDGDRSVELQITDMGFKEEEEKKSDSETFYG